MATDEQNNEKLLRRIEKLPDIIKEPTSDALRQQAEELAALMRSVAPFKTGKLRDSIRVEPGEHSLQWVVRAGGETTTRKYSGRSATYERDVKIGSGDTAGVKRGGGGGITYDYALAVEFGTSGGFGDK